MVLHDDMTGQINVVDENGIVTNLAVMRDVATDHKQTAMTNPRYASAASGSRMHGDVFADDVVIPDHQHRWLTRVLLVLWRGAQTGKGIHLAPRAQTGLTLHNNMRMQHTTITQHHAPADVTERANGDITPQLRAVFDDGRGVNVGEGVITLSRRPRCP